MRLANTALQLTNTDAAQSAILSLCLLSVLAAERNVGLSRKRRVPGAVRQSAAAVSKVGERAAMWPDSRGVCGLLGEQAFRCVGTTVRRDHDVLASTGCRVAVMRRGSGTLAPTVGVASAVRRDSAAPGLRYQRASTVTVTRAVRRKSGAPGLRCAEASSPQAMASGTPGSLGQHGTTSGADRPGFSDRSLDPSRLGAEPPERASPGVLDLSGSTLPTSDRPLRAPTASPDRSRGDTSVDGSALSGSIDTSEAFGSMRPRAFAGYLIPLRCGCVRIGAIPVAGLRRGGADGRVVRNAAAFSGDAALNGSRAPHQGRATRSEHLGCPAPAARAQRAHHRTSMATTALGKKASLPLRVPCDPSGKYKCQFQIFTCNAPARKPTQLGADGRACGARGGAARLRRPPAAQANVRLAENALKR